MYIISVEIGILLVFLIIDMVSKPDISYYYNINIDMLNKYLY